MAVAAHLVGMDDLPHFLTLRELAELLGIPPATIYDWRLRGLGPRAYRFGKHLRFAADDVAAWLDEQRETTPGAGPDGRAAGR